MEYEQANNSRSECGYPAASTHFSEDDAPFGESKGSNVVVVTGDDPCMAKGPDERHLESTDEIDDAINELADQIPGLTTVKADSRKARDLNNPYKRQSSVVQEGAFDNIGEVLKYIPGSRPQSGNFKSAQPTKIFFDSALHQGTARIPGVCSKGTENWCLIKTRLFFNELKLLIHILFWIDDEDHTSDITHHSESSVIKVRAKHTDSLHFTIGASSENDEYFLKKSKPIKKSFKLEYFSWDTCRKFEFRVNPGPDKIPSKYIDIDFEVQAGSMEPQKIYTRFNNLDKHENTTRFQEQRQERKATEHCNDHSINPSMHFHRHYGDLTHTTTGRTIVEKEGNYHETAYDTTTTIKPG